MNNVSVRYHGGIITVWQNYRNCVQNIDTKLYLQFVPMMRQQQISRYMNKHLSDSYTLRFSLMFIQRIQYNTIQYNTDRSAKINLRNF
jgi:hypothetical protein